MVIRADGKDWTWVVERACPECGFDPEAVSYGDISHLVHGGLERWPAVLSRLDSMLAQDDPPFQDWDQDAAATDGAYGDQDPATVVGELMEAGGGAAEAFAAVPAELRSRTGRRGDGVRFTVGTLALYFAHEHVHHLWDVE